MHKQRALKRLFLLACLFIAVQTESSLYAITPPTPSIFPDTSGQVMLIRNTIVAVNHGNITGNYTVLRDLASERFRQQNTAADLAKTFTTLRDLKFDLSPILIVQPQLTQSPAEDNFRGRLQLVGYFSTRPQAVQFTLIFQRIKKGWMIDEISLTIAPTSVTVPALPIKSASLPAIQRPQKLRTYSTPSDSRPTQPSRYPNSSPRKDTPHP